jgi:hypothetical protein
MCTFWYYYCYSYFYCCCYTATVANTLLVLVLLLVPVLLLEPLLLLEISLFPVLELICTPSGAITVTVTGRSPGSNIREFKFDFRYQYRYRCLHIRSHFGTGNFKALSYHDR